MLLNARKLLLVTALTMLIVLSLFKGIEYLKEKNKEQQKLEELNLGQQQVGDGERAASAAAAAAASGAGPTTLADAPPESESASEAELESESAFDSNSNSNSNSNSAQSESESDQTQTSGARLELGLEETGDLVALESSSSSYQNVSLGEAADSLGVSGERTAEEQSSQWAHGTTQTSGDTSLQLASAPNSPTTTSSRAKRRGRARNRTRHHNQTQPKHQQPTSTTMENVKRAAQMQQDNYQQIDILLERNNYILHNRCSSRLYVQMNIPKRRAQIGSKQQRTTTASLFANPNNKRQPAPNRKSALKQQQQFPQQQQSASHQITNDPARIRLLSTIITVESVPPSERLRQNTINSNINSNSNKAELTQLRHEDRAQISRGGRNFAASARRAQVNEVKLRANLTELYICFDESGNLEAKVNGSTPSCSFNELPQDRHVKYQSAINPSWFIGFDKLGNPIKGSMERIPEPKVNMTGTSHHNLETSDGLLGPTADKVKLTKVEPQLEAIGRERCFLFTKLNRLTTSTQVFPEALDIIATAADKQQLPSHLLLLTSSPSSYSSLASNRTAADIEHEIKTYQSAQLASLAKKRGSSTTNFILHTFNQKQLINMTRYRNILRYQMGRSAGQSILPDNSDSQTKHHRVNMDNYNNNIISSSIHASSSYNNYTKINDTNQNDDTNKMVPVPFEPRAVAAAA